MGVIDVSDDEHPSKRQCPTAIDDDLSLLKGEIGGIKDSIQGIAAQAREDMQKINRKLDELLCKVQRTTVILSQ